jgi:hypothetical protein
VLFFGLPTWVLALAIAAVMLLATAGGLVLGRVLATQAEERGDGESLREPFGVLQGALIGFMGLVLAFGLSLAVTRYESRRSDVVTAANAIGTTYLRAQTLAEPVRTESLALLRHFTDTTIAITETVPGTADQRREVATSARDEDRLWALAGQALDEAPVATAPRLYVESLNEMFDSQASLVYGLTNRVPTAVLLIEVVGAAVATAALALHLAMFGRGVPTVIIASLLVTVLLVVTFDLDRPTRGLIRVPATPLIDVRTSMTGAPAAAAPSGR